MEMTTRPFIPRDKPRSFVVAVLAGLGALAAGGTTFLGHYLGSAILFQGGRFLLYLCVLVALPMMAVCLVRSWFGHYEKIEEKSWNDQAW
jgi:hypothetical protein